jgi:hypothetical protein
MWARAEEASRTKSRISVPSRPDTKTAPRTTSLIELSAIRISLRQGESMT